MNVNPPNFIKEYTIYDVSKNIIKSGTIKAHKKRSLFEAKAGTGGYLEKQYPNCEIVITKCIDESDSLNIFNDIFGSSNMDINSIFNNFKKK